jgi:hypothetical protein
MGILVCLAISRGYSAQPDFEVSGPDGRRILLKEDGTWRYAEAKEEPSKENPKETPAAVLRVEHRTAISDNGCSFTLALVNNLPYEIRQFIPTFAAHRSNGVVYDSVSTRYSSIKPGNSQTQEIVFRGISCQNIARLQVGGGERCQMGDLERFTSDQAKCLARIRVMESNLVRFDK